MLKTALTTADMKRMDIYSARNIITNGTELYSVLNPLTSSDSPSEKSKGERFVSASDVMNRSIITKNRYVLRLESFKVIRLKQKKRTQCNKMIVRHTSYDTD